MIDATVIYYTSNHLDETNPFFLENTKKQLSKAIGDLPMVAVSHKPINKFTNGDYKNVVASKDFKLYREGRHHLNIYWQMLVGAKEAKTKYIFMSEDDILYSHSHFHSDQIEKEFKSHGDVMLYDMNKVSLFTWSVPPIFSFRSKRKVINQLIAPRKMFIDALEERFRRVEELLSQGMKEDRILKFFGDIGRYERQLGVTVQPSVEFFSQEPSIVFSHPEAYGFLSQGTRKRHGDIKIVELYNWGTGTDIMKLWGDKPIR